MRNRSRALKTALALSLAACLSGCATQLDRGGVSKLDTGTVFQDLAGNKVSLAEFSSGAPMFVTFFASWCYVCTTEIPEINRIYSEYEDEGLAVFAVNVGDTKNVLLKYIDKNEVDYPVLHDIDGATSRKAANLYGLPLNILADAKGNVVYYDHAPPPDVVIQNLLKHHYER